MSNEMQIMKPTNQVSTLGSAANADAQRAIAEVQAEMYLAKQFPRDRMAVAEAVLRECSRESLAEVSVYTYNRGGQDVSGPSIRLAESIAGLYGNIDYGWNEVSRSDGVSEIVAFAWDKETNVRRSTKFFVSHIREKKSGNVKLTGERDIYELCANMAARRMRACILNILPGDLVEAATNQCEATLKAKATVTPERIKSMVEGFAKFGVTKAQIEARLMRKLESMNSINLIQMGKIYNSLRDGMSTPEEWFSPTQKPGDQSTGAEKREKSALDDFAASNFQKREAPVDPAPAQKIQPEPAKKVERTPEEIADEFLLEIRTIESSDKLNAFVVSKGRIIDNLPQEIRGVIEDETAKRFSEFEELEDQVGEGSKESFEGEDIPEDRLF